MMEGGVVYGWATLIFLKNNKIRCLLIDVILLLDRICQMGMVDKWSILRKVKTIILLTKLVDIFMSVGLCPNSLFKTALVCRLHGNTIKNQVVYHGFRK